MNIGDHVGDYEIIASLGAGGMGQVYKVRHLYSDRIEAMKVLLPTLESNSELAERFLREIKVQAALDHPNIAKLYTAFNAEGRLLMVMEYIDGDSLSALAARSPIPVADLMRYADQCLSALGYAHSRGVVHRDIKPGNLMVTHEGQLKLMDFGIARLKTDQRLTQTGGTVGSLYYMSPEQIDGKEPDARSDLYALGVTLYELVTQQRPFGGESAYTIMAAHLTQTPPPPREIVPGIPETLSDLIVMAMARDPQARFQNAEAMRAVLRRAMGNAPAPVAPVESSVPRAMGSVPPPLPSVESPAAAPQQSVPEDPIPAKPASRRALYMTIGSLATVAILAGLAFEAPKFLRTRAEDANQLAATPTQSAPTPEATPETTPTPPSATPTPQSAAAPTPLPSLKPEVAQPRSKRTAAEHSPSPRAAAPVDLARQEPAPATVAPAPPATSPAASPAPSAVASPAASPNTAELKDLHEQYDDLAIRAATVHDGLASLQNQMAAQGLGLRADVRQAAMRMDQNMRQAMDALQASDADGARKHLELARVPLGFIEKFLGQ